MPYHPRHLHFCINQNQTMLIQVNKRYFHNARFSRFLRQEVFNNNAIKVAWIRRSVGRGWPVNLAKTRRKMTTANSFSRQNDAGSRASTTQYWGNLVLVVVVRSQNLSSITKPLPENDGPRLGPSIPSSRPKSSLNSVIPMVIFDISHRVYTFNPRSLLLLLKDPESRGSNPVSQKILKNGENFWAKIVYMSNMREKHRRLF